MNERMSIHNYRFFRENIRKQDEMMRFEKMYGKKEVKKRDRKKEREKENGGSAEQ